MRPGSGEGGGEGGGEVGGRGGENGGKNWRKRLVVSTVEWKKNDLSLGKAILYTYRACYSLYLKSKSRMCF